MKYPVYDCMVLSRLTFLFQVSDQMLILYRSTCLDDLAIRLRFLTARQVEASIAGIFPVNKCLLFGSSVNGFGRLGCDLDLLIQFDTDSEVVYLKNFFIQCYTGV